MSLRAAPTAESYFLSPALAQRLDLVQHLLEFGSQIIVVTGAAGSGKTAFLDELQRRVGNSSHVCRIEATGDDDSSMLLSAVAQALDLDFRMGDHLEDGELQLERFLALGESSRVVVLVDDADRLRGDTLPTLLGWARMTERGGALRLLLTGEATLTARVSEVLSGMPQPELPHAMELPRLALSETEAFLALYGFSGLGAARLSRLHVGSAGLPGQMLTLARERPQAQSAPAPESALPPGSDARLWTPSPRVAAVLGAGLVAGFLAIWTFSLIGSHDNAAQPQVKVTVQLPAPAAPVEANAATEGASAGAGPAAGAAAPAQPAPELESPAVVAPIVPAVEPQTVATTLEPMPPAAAVTPTGTAAAAIAPAAEEKAAPAQDKPTAPFAKRDAEPAPMQVTVAEPAPKKRPPSEHKSAEHKEPRPQTEPAAGTPRDEAWVARQNPSSWVLQLYGSHERAAAHRFIAQYGLGQKAAVVSTLRNQAAWYVVVYGLYPSREKALAAVARLPTAIQKLKPWPRSVAAVGEAMRVRG